MRGRSYLPCLIDTVLHQFNDELCKALDTIAPIEGNSSCMSYVSPKGNLGLTRLSRLGIKWYETGSRFGINILNLIPGRPIKWKGMYTTDFSIIRKNSL